MIWDMDGTKNILRTILGCPRNIQSNVINKRKEQKKAIIKKDKWFHQNITLVLYIESKTPLSLTIKWSCQFSCPGGFQIPIQSEP